MSNIIKTIETEEHTELNEQQFDKLVWKAYKTTASNLNTILINRLSLQKNPQLLNYITEVEEILLRIKEFIFFPNTKKYTRWKIANHYSTSLVPKTHIFRP